MDGVSGRLCDFTLHFHLGNANVVVDALSRKSREVLASVVSRE